MPGRRRRMSCFWKKGSMQRDDSRCAPRRISHSSPISDAPHHTAVVSWFFRTPGAPDLRGGYVFLERRPRSCVFRREAISPICVMTIDCLALARSPFFFLSPAYGLASTYTGKLGYGCSLATGAMPRALPINGRHFIPRLSRNGYGRYGEGGSVSPWYWICLISMFEWK